MPWQGGRAHCCGLSGRFLPFLICFLIEGLALPAQLPRHYLLPVAQVLASLAWPWVITWSSGVAEAAPLAGVGACLESTLI